MPPTEVVKYRVPVRALHWIHSGAFVLLFLTGFMLYLPRQVFGSIEQWTHRIHLGAAVIFVVVPVIYLIIFPRSVWRGLKIAFTWGKDDLKWFIAAPGYYLFGNKKNMPAQGFLNSGQKLWFVITILSFLTFIVTGAVRWFFVKTASALLLHDMMVAHDIAFAVTGVLFLGHVYLGIFNPKAQEALKAMTRGTVTAEYAKEYHGKWYEKVAGEKKD